MEPMDIYKCIWKIMAENESSTTFADVNNENHPLYRCKYECDGYDKNCPYRRPLINYLQYSKQKRIYNRYTI